MLNDLNRQQKALTAYMSAISERCYSAEWMLNLEYALWDAVQNGPRTYGHGKISHSDIAELKKLVENSNCWIYFDANNEETAIPLQQWENKFNEILTKDNSVIRG